MAEWQTSGVWKLRMLFVSLAMAFLFIRLLPLQTLPSAFGGPDIMLALIFYLSLQRPESVPSLLIGAAILLEDLFLQRPPGLMAALVILGSAWLKLAASHAQDRNWIKDWWMSALAMIGITVVLRVILTIALVPRPPALLHYSQLVATIIVFPIVAFFAYYVLHIRPETAQVRDKSRGLS